MGIEDLLQDKREEILRLAEQHGASNVRVFGSVARGEADEDSDIDFLVDFKTGTSLIDYVGLKQDLEDLLGFPVDVVQEKSLRPELRPYVMKDVVSLR